VTSLGRLAGRARKCLAWLGGRTKALGRAMPHHSSHYVLSLQNYNKYGKIKLSSTPRFAYSAPGFNAAFKLYHVYSPVVYPGKRTSQNIEVKQSDLTAADLKGSGHSSGEELTKSEPVTKEDIADIKKYPIKVSEQQFQDLQKRQNDYSTGLAAPPNKKKKMHISDHFGFD